ncbi:hypothetical protein [Mycolicibacterium phlei]
MAEDPLDVLYAARLEDFTALRTELAREAKKHGDAETAKRIAAARKPTTAAWVVNQLAHADDDAARRLRELGERLRDAHAAMDGARIRELTGEQRRLVEAFTKAVFEEAGIKATGALRDDVTATLQAAVADPDVADRLGRLTKAEQWSGFGEFGDTAIVVSPSAKRRAAPKKPEPEPEPEDDREAAEERRQAREELTAAERARADADDTLDELQSDLAAARLRHQDAQRRLEEAARALAEAEEAYAAAKQATRDAAARIKAAKDRVRRAK